MGRKITSLQVNRALDKFEESGPYTLEEALKVADMCNQTDDFEIIDTLDEVAHKFSPSEFEKLLFPETHLTKEQLKIWKTATAFWKVTLLDAEYSDEHLKSIAKMQSENFDNMLKENGARWFSDELKLQIAKEIRDGKRKRELEWERRQVGQPEEPDRDESPERK